MHYHLIGIKGSGMASLAEILVDLGHRVTGSDIERYIFTQKALEEKHIPITSFHKNNIQEHSIVIIGNAFNDDNEEVKQAKEMASVTCYYYHEFLGKLLQDYTSISVAGTHGKTTTTGLLAHVMGSHLPTAYLIGDGTGKMPKDSKYFIVESCEYKRHFLAYKPDYAIITNIELDHVDYFHSMKDYIAAFEEFANQVKKGIVLFGDDEHVRSLSLQTEHLYYGLEEHNDVQAVHLSQGEEGMSFDVLYKGELFGHFSLPFVGMPLLWNSLAVIAIGIMEGLPYSILQEGLSSFEGVKRRFHVEECNEHIYIDDYAHHPTAISLMIEAAKIKYPNRPVFAIFKPDRYSRIYHFMNDFAKALGKADQVVLCHFPENAIKEEGIDITIEDLRQLCPKAFVVDEDEKGAQAVAKLGNGVYLFMSSKDIYKFKNIVKNFH